MLLRKYISVGTNVSRDADDLGFTKNIEYTRE